MYCLRFTIASNELKRLLQRLLKKQEKINNSFTLKFTHLTSEL